MEEEKAAATEAFPENAADNSTADISTADNAAAKCIEDSASEFTPVNETEAAEGEKTSDINRPDKSGKSVGEAADSDAE